MEPQIPPRQHLTRDQIVQKQILYSYNIKYVELSRHLSVTVCQVQYA